jgi:hypothetical protein
VLRDKKLTLPPVADDIETKRQLRHVSIRTVVGFLFNLFSSEVDLIALGCSSGESRPRLKYRGMRYV